jgi:hypothetical protein
MAVSVCSSVEAAKPSEASSPASNTAGRRSRRQVEVDGLGVSIALNL